MSFSPGSIQSAREINEGDNAPSLVMKSPPLTSVIHFREVINGISARTHFKFQWMTQDSVSSPFNLFQSTEQYFFVRCALATEDLKRHHRSQWN
jgi:hypothetical protein